MFNILRNIIKRDLTEFKTMLDNGAIMLDVRTPQEFNQGHFEGSINIPVTELQQKLHKFKGKSLIVVCRSGQRSGMACDMLNRAGIEAVNAGPWQTLKEI